MKLEVMGSLGEFRNGFFFNKNITIITSNTVVRYDGHLIQLLPGSLDANTISQYLSMTAILCRGLPRNPKLG